MNKVIIREMGGLQNVRSLSSHEDEKILLSYKE